MQTARFRVYAAIGAVVVAAGVSVAARAPQGGPVVAWVNTEVILQQTPGFAAAESTMIREVSIMRADLEALSQRLDSALTAFNQASISLSPAAREERQNELRQLNQQYQQRTNDAQVRAEQRQRELMAPLQERIQAVVDGVRAERNLALVFDVAAPGNNLMSADPALDLTGLIVRRLRGGAQ